MSQAVAVEPQQLDTPTKYVSLTLEVVLEVPVDMTTAQAEEIVGNWRRKLPEGVMETDFYVSDTSFSER
jgi:hypothetical protein